MLLVDNLRFQTDLGLLTDTWLDSGVLPFCEMWEEAGVVMTPRLQAWYTEAIENQSS